MTLVMPASMALPEKNPRWAGNITPNTELEKNGEYYDLSEMWCRQNKIPDFTNLFEVRLVSSGSSLALHRSSRWWDDPLFLDKIFWVYQKPIGMTAKDGTHTQLYALEFYECVRIAEIAEAKFGYNPFPSIAPSLCVPCECCELAWDDTEGGYSRHCREDLSLPPTQQELDKEALIQEEVKEIQKELVDVSNNEAWLTDNDKRNLDRKPN